MLNILILDNSLDQASLSSGVSVPCGTIGHAKWCTASELKKDSENRTRIISLTVG